MKDYAPPPSIEERLCAAAHAILTDGRQHAPQATFWAFDFLVESSGGHTEFMRRVQAATTTTTRRDHAVSA